MRSLSARSFAVRSCPVVVRPAWIRPEARRSNAPSGGRCLSNGPPLAGHGIVSGGDVSPGPGQRPEAAALSRAGALASEVYYSALHRFADQRLWAIEMNRSLSPQLGRGFHQARVDLPPKQTFVVIPGDGGYPLADGLEVLALAQLAERKHGQRCAGGGELGPRAALTPRW